MDELQKKLNYRFKNLELLRSALIHKSFNEGGKNCGADNERLEFLGDSVISLAITDYIYRRCRDNNEGDLAKMRAHCALALVVMLAMAVGRIKANEAQHMRRLL